MNLEYDIRSEWIINNKGENIRIKNNKDIMK